MTPPKKRLDREQEPPRSSIKQQRADRPSKTLP